MAKKRKWFRVIKRKTKRGEYTRVFIFDRNVFGYNHHEFKGRKSKHIHIGSKFIKIVLSTKELRGIWVYIKKYVRISDLFRRKDKK